VVATVSAPVIVVAIVTASLVSLLLIRVLLRFAASSRISILVLVLGLIAIFSGITSLLSGFG
jgi:undecaprenyl pyrophosphate phosphatase UppP